MCRHLKAPLVSLFVLVFVVGLDAARHSVRLAPSHEQDPTALHSRTVDTRAEFKVLEEQPPGTVVGTIPTKPGFTYRFNEAPAEFVLNASTGVISTSRQLDRESLSSDKIDLVVLSSQPTYPIEVRVSVIDINDNSPKFPDDSIAISFSESANAGTRVLLDTATDGDLGDNDVTTQYKILSGNEEGKFKLAVTTNPSGETPYLHLETTGPLDRETKAFYQLNISAQDGGNPPRYGYLLVNTTIQDVNDNPPIFDHSDYIVSLNESVPPGTRVLQVTASDADIGDNARVTYSLQNTVTQFTVDPDTGVITTAEPLKCQKTDCTGQKRCPKSCVFTVFAQDGGAMAGGAPRQYGRTYVTVNLLDANDHEPIIKFRYFPSTAEFATVDEDAENGSVVAAVSVIDNDEGLNGETAVEIVSGNELGHFRLDNNAIFDIVRVNGDLDREKINQYNLTMVATDRGSPPRSSRAYLIIHVNDINDHEPVFEKSEYSTTLRELVPIGSFVASVTASDQDTGINSLIYYSIVSGNDNFWFDMDIRTGLVTTRERLDRELQGSVILNISARDGGPNPKWAYSTLKITILDENDEAPKFSETFFSTRLSETAPSNSLVAALTAIDHDQGTNGSVSYVFDVNVEQDYPGIFALDTSSGRVTTKTKLDREVIPEYTIRVIARDQGTPTMSSTATISLIVDDVNDNSPEFYPLHYFVAVKETLPLESPVIQVSATDPDAGNNAVIHYFISSGGDGLFVIEETTGVVRLKGQLGHLRKSQYRVRVAAKDAGGRKALDEAIVDVVVEHEDSERLVFSQANGYAFSVTEDTGDIVREREIGRAVVLMKDSSQNVKYSIVSGDPLRTFSIDEDSGVIRNVKRIDREQAAFFHLEVVARLFNSATYGRTKVNISVSDLNDNPPKFTKTRVFVEVEENAPIGHGIFLASATDPDVGINAEVQYELTVNPGGIFHMSPDDGMILLRKHVFSAGKSLLNLEVTATDKGSPPRSARQYVTVEVVDVNDHTPTFPHSSYETSLLESVPVNERFFTLNAFDEDQGLNGLVSYAITTGNEDEMFGIFPDGHLYVKRELDRETKDYYAFTVEASDSGAIPRRSSVSLVVHVVDENDNPPMFLNETFEFFLSENEPPDSFVGKLLATDKDIGRNSELTFSISERNNDFFVDPKLGYLKTLRPFDREALLRETGSNFMFLSATVTDNGIQRLKHTCVVRVYITDANDNPPVFEKKVFKNEVSESAEIGSHIMRIRATDADDGLNGDIVYSIKEGNENDVFTIDSATGILSLQNHLDREKQDQYSLKIQAEDAGSLIRLSSVASVIINVLDENDNAPVFSTYPKSVSVLETAKVGIELLKFSATDADLDVNQEISFAIAEGSFQDVFRLDALTGVFYLNKPLDYEQTPVYRLNVTASDAGVPSLSSTAAIEILVEDVNDNPPMFPSTAIVRQIQEGIPVKSAIVTITAEDPDSGGHGKISYRISHQDPPGEHFGINPETGVISTLRNIDREFADTFRLTVVATDQGGPDSPPLSAEKTVTVIVEDINDNAPFFVSMEAAVLAINSGTGSLVTEVKAKDLDANTNGLVTYELLRGDSQLFNLDHNSGKLTLKTSIPNPSSLVLHRLTIRATDEAVQSQRKFADSSLTLFGVGSDGPTFQQRQYTGSVAENEPKGTSILTVQAKYPDLLIDIEYYITEIRDESGRLMEKLFDVDAKRGVVQTAAILDREEGAEVYELTLFAVTTGAIVPQTTETKSSPTIVKSDSLWSYLNVRGGGSEEELGRSWVELERKEFVGDEEAQQRAVVPYLCGEGKWAGQPVCQLSFYCCPSQQQKGREEVEEKGDRTLRTFSPLLENIFHFPARLPTCKGEGRTPSGQLFSPDKVFVAISPDLLHSVIWADSNLGRLGSGARFPSGHPRISGWCLVRLALIWVLTSGMRQTFFQRKSSTQQRGRIGKTNSSTRDVAHKTGGVFVTVPPHLFMISSVTHSEPIVASGSSSLTVPGMSPCAAVRISVTDRNDSPPVLAQAGTVLEVSEEAQPGHVVATLTATDADTIGTLSFALVKRMDDPGWKKFVVDSASGVLSLRRTLDHEETPSYRLTIRVEDGVQHSDAEIQIKVLDSNDNAPAFSLPAYSFDIPEDMPRGSSVGRVTAEDADDGEKGEVGYSVISDWGNDVFSLNPQSGVFTLTSRLDYEQAREGLSADADA
ncbi:unnamed protein product [Cyprideis torosa]|uniref:Uncharacterized protein n=1 Tax=Cyprideis torosa TaxID=163714 RepID=A0A7R8W387_9CRUS|nr:unnamed protein product [Cyprideis torosa]CAG0879401.1 unnamed protein product [Cyprideis torosa]